MTFSDSDSTPALLHAYHSGPQLKSDELRQLEQVVTEGKASLSDTITFLGYLKNSPSADSISRFATVLIELIETQPELEILAELTFDDKIDEFKKVSELWLSKVKECPDKLTTLFNAAKFHQMFEPELANEFWLRGLEIDGCNKLKWLTALTLFHFHHSFCSEEVRSREHLVLAIGYLERAIELTDENPSYLNTYKQMVLNDLVDQALNQNAPELAEQCGNLMISLYPKGKKLPYGFFWGKLALVKAKLLEQKLVDAEEHFEEICSPAVPIPKKFDLEIVRPFLAHGRTELVLKFLSSYKRALLKDEVYLGDQLQLSPAKEEKLKQLKQNRQNQYTRLAEKIDSLIDQIQSGVPSSNIESMQLDQ